MKARHILPGRILLIALIPAMVFMTACGSWWLPRPHKIDVQQGNLLSLDSIEQIQVGMSKSDVVSILGRPLTSNVIDVDRWDYIYSINRSGEDPKVKRLSLDFVDDVVANLETDGLDSE